MIERKTQTAEYWQSLTLTQADLDFIHSLMLDAEQPMTAAALANALVNERCRVEEAELRSNLTSGTVYQPKKTYNVGETVLFPALDFRAGEVIDVRAGENPEYGQFDVITVDFGPDRRQRMYAASLSAPHKLNADLPDLLASAENDSPEQLLATKARRVPELIAEQLAQHAEFASFENRWLLRDLLAEIHIGHLNIAEALIDVHATPVDTATLMHDMDLPKEIPTDIATFSVQSALAADGRFDQVGPGETRLWSLCRLEPAEALETPLALRYSQIDFNRSELPVDLLQLEWELDDEWTDDGGVGVSDARASAPTTTLLLTYPHRASGTIPMNKRSRTFFPTGHGERTVVTLIDGRWGQPFQAWAVHRGRYIAGLRNWFEQHKIPAGAYITLERKPETGEVVVDFRPKRMRREWARWAQVTPELALDIQLRKQEVACEYDEDIIIGEDQPEEIAELRESPQYAEASLDVLVHRIFVDLAGLSQQGTVHAKTVYSAINLVRRCPPGPIFACLATDDRIQPMGNNQFRLRI